MSIFKVIANDADIIPYRKELNAVTGGVTASILLVQMMYWWKKNNHKPFYKFKEPCNHPSYKEGDSWCEELGFSKTEFDTAFKKLEALGFISKKITVDRITFYSVDIDVLGKAINPIYLNQNADLPKAENLTYEKQKTCRSKSRKPDFVTITETTTETTTENIYCPPAKASDTLSTTYKEVIDYLNNTLQTSYKSTTAKTQTLIKARIKEGFSVDDFKTVIDKKVLQWKYDSKMSTYLRPETLFGNKFESYLNESRTKTAQTSNAMRAVREKAESVGVSIFALYDHLDNYQDIPTQPYNDEQINIFEAELC